MADWDDFFQSGPRTDDKQPLERLQDNDRVPDLRKYKMGDLREWVRASNPFPAILPKGVIRAGSQIAKGILTSDHLSNGAVTAAEVKWDEMPPVRLATWVSNNDSAFSVTNSGSLALLTNTDSVATLPALLTARTGYTRQYRLVAAVAHINTGSETGYAVYLSAYYAGSNPSVTITHNGTDFTTGMRYLSSGWGTSAVYDSGVDVERLHLYGRREYIGSAPGIYARSVALEGRYVPA